MYVLLSMLNTHSEICQEKNHYLLQSRGLGFMNRSKWILCLDVFIPRVFKALIKVIVIYFRVKCCVNWENKKNNLTGRNVC